MLRRIGLTLAIAACFGCFDALPPEVALENVRQEEARAACAQAIRDALPPQARNRYRGVHRNVKRPDGAGYSVVINFEVENPFGAWLKVTGRCHAHTNESGDVTHATLHGVS